MEIYLDNSATTRPGEAAVQACLHAMTEEYGNPSSLHKKGYEAERRMDAARRSIASALFCDPSEILFTSGATESNNLALFGAVQANARKGKTVVISAIEHPSVMEAAAQLEKQGFRVKRILPENGSYTAAQFAQAVDDDTVLVSMMLVNNETGLLLPAFEAAKAIKQKNPQTLVHVDAVQGFLKVPVRLKNSAVDLLSISGHKVHAPKGIGVLYHKKGVRLTPLLYGGHQQENLRPGTESMPLIAAFGAAVEAQRTHIPEYQAHYQALKSHLRELISGVEGITIHSGENCAPHIISMAVYGVRSETMIHYLEQHEIYVSSGSACSKGAPSYVLTALGLDRMTADETIRVSFCPDTTPEMLDEFVKILLEAQKVLIKQRN